MMQCPTCKGVKMIQSGAGSGIGVALSQCPTCSGSGVLYTQAEIDELKHEIETLNKIIAQLTERIADPEYHSSNPEVIK
jgi:Zn-finger nucleic acid-binding protein